MHSFLGKATERMDVKHKNRILIYREWPIYWLKCLHSHLLQVSKKEENNVENTVFVYVIKIDWFFL